jgi:hypothetical protein
MIMFKYVSAFTTPTTPSPSTTTTLMKRGSVQNHLKSFIFLQFLRFGHQIRFAISEDPQKTSMQ